MRGYKSDINHLSEKKMYFGQCMVSENVSWNLMLEILDELLVLLFPSVVFFF